MPYKKNKRKATEKQNACGKEINDKSSQQKSVTHAIRYNYMSYVYE
jgi:hypothetical protein